MVQKICFKAFTFIIINSTSLENKYQVKTGATFGCRPKNVYGSTEERLGYKFFGAHPHYFSTWSNNFVLKLRSDANLNYA
jgi:hypothetical protein